MLSEGEMTPWSTDGYKFPRNPSQLDSYSQYDAAQPINLSIFKKKKIVYLFCSGLQNSRNVLGKSLVFSASQLMKTIE